MTRLITSSPTRPITGAARSANPDSDVNNQILANANQRYHLRPGTFRVDIDTFDAHLTRAESLQGYAALAEYQRALSLYAAPFLGHEIFEWQAPTGMTITSGSFGRLTAPRPSRSIRATRRWHPSSTNASASTTRPWPDTKRR